ncbi:hypothetical protein FXO38_01033 [Capsicum annuum]|nr:hypothetical protein FXO38_01033 [Capsicum annuum]
MSSTPGRTHNRIRLAEGPTKNGSFGGLPHASNRKLRTDFGLELMHAPVVHLSTRSRGLGQQGHVSLAKPSRWKRNWQHERQVSSSVMIKNAEGPIVAYHGGVFVELVAPRHHGTVYHGAMEPRHHGTMSPWQHAPWHYDTALYGTMEPWYQGTTHHGTMETRTMAPRHQVTKASHTIASCSMAPYTMPTRQRAPWYKGTMAPRTMAPRHRVP